MDVNQNKNTESVSVVERCSDLEFLSLTKNENTNNSNTQNSITNNPPVLTEEVIKKEKTKFEKEKKIILKALEEKTDKVSKFFFIIFLDKPINE